MRARNVKPGLFTNEVLGDADPLITILFVGLWCAADREGRLEDRPLRLCGQLFPYRRSVTGEHVDQMLGWLDERGFVKRYTAGGKRIIQILEFGKHQSPHSNESASRLPPMPSLDNTASNHGQKSLSPSLEARRSDSLIPDSGSSDSGLLIADTGDSAESNSQSVHQLTEFERHERFERCKAKYPSFAGRQDWIPAEKAASRLVDQQLATWDQLEAACERYAAYCAATRSTGTQYVMRPGLFFTADDMPWRQEWNPPAVEQVTEDRSAAAVREFLKGAK